ncbi:MAG TPA: methylated-DNA--[protein]-cysteine S-methyltransferase [Longimicrobiales bacterium]
MQQQRTLPTFDEMYGAVLARDSRYDGIFFTAVKTTGIFCRPSCPAKKPQRTNVEFHGTAKAALAHGFRPCLRCRPMEPTGAAPPAVRALIAEIEADPAVRVRDHDLRARGLEPAAIRRWFKQHHGMTFHAYQRARRLASALGALSNGDPITHVAFDNGYESLSGFQEAIRQVTGRSASRSRGTAVVHLTRVLTPLGPMLMGVRDEGVCLLEFTDRPMLPTQLQRVMQRLDCVFAPGTNEIGEQMRAELDAYFDGALQEFATPLSPMGSEFQQRVWDGLRTIPYGETRSYAEQARAIGSPSAVRAVARANGDNRIAIVIPCHRVVGSDGSLTGYGGGLHRKRFLLDLEMTHRPQAMLASLASTAS